LARPNGHERVPMIGRGNGDSIDILVLQQLAHIDARFCLWKTQLLHVPEPLARHAFIHIAQCDDLRSWHARKTVNVIVAAASHSANCHPDAIIRTEDLAAQRKCRCSHSYRFSRRLQKFTPLDGHSCPPLVRRHFCEPQYTLPVRAWTLGRASVENLLA